MNSRLITFFGLVFGSMLFFSCQGQQGSGRSDNNEGAVEDYREKMIENNRRMLEEERAWMEEFIDEKNWSDSLQPTGGGAYFYPLNFNSDLARIQTKQKVTFLCRSALLDGTPLYIDQDSIRHWQVDRTDGELGLHNILKKMGSGEKAYALLPSYQAFGIAGDLDEVPPRAPVLFYLEIIEVEK
ncbi:MAG: hypothetical protein JJU02_05220 [Cryomorphaceae bacterium]|nr:hypothetical protein [Cryomorphaceae bacterium]